MAPVARMAAFFVFRKWIYCWLEAQTEMMKPFCLLSKSCEIERINTAWPYSCSTVRKKTIKRLASRANITTFSLMVNIRWSGTYDSIGLPSSFRKESC